MPKTGPYECYNCTRAEYDCEECDGHHPDPPVHETPAVVMDWTPCDQDYYPDQDEQRREYMQAITG